MFATGLLYCQYSDLYIVNNCVDDVVCDEQLQGTGCLIATGQKVFTLSDVAKPFINFEEMKAAAATC